MVILIFPHFVIGFRWFIKTLANMQKKNCRLRYDQKICPEQKFFFISLLKQNTAEWTALRCHDYLDASEQLLEKSVEKWKIDTKTKRPAKLFRYFFFLLLYLK